MKHPDPSGQCHKQDEAAFSLYDPQLWNKRPESLRISATFLLIVIKLYVVFLCCYSILSIMFNHMCVYCETF